MVTIDNKHLLISIESEDPNKLLIDIRSALTTVTSILVESDEFNYYPAVPDALAALIRMNGELIAKTNP